MSRLTEKSNTRAEKCTFAQLIDASDTQTPCQVQQLSEDLQVCYGCGRNSSVIQEKHAAVFEESDRARQLIASFVSVAITSSNDRPLSIVGYRNNKAQHYSYAELVDGDGVDPEAYECMHLELSGDLHMIVRPPDLEATEKATPCAFGLSFDRDLVEAVIGPLSEEQFHSAQKLLANGWSYKGATPATHDSYAHVLFWKGYERKYTHPDGKVVTVPKGIQANIGKSIFCLP